MPGGYELEEADRVKGEKGLEDKHLLSLRLKKSFCLRILSSSRKLIYSLNKYVLSIYRPLSTLPDTAQRTGRESDLKAKTQQKLPYNGNVFCFVLFCFLT